MAVRKNDSGICLAEIFLHVRPTDSKQQACSADVGVEPCLDIEDFLPADEL